MRRHSLETETRPSCTQHLGLRSFTPLTVDPAEWTQVKLELPVDPRELQATTESAQSLIKHTGNPQVQQELPSIYHAQEGLTPKDSGPKCQ